MSSPWVIPINGRRTKGTKPKPFADSRIRPVINRRRVNFWTDLEISRLRDFLNRGWRDGAPPFERMTLDHVRGWLGPLASVEGMARTAAIIHAMRSCGWVHDGHNTFRRAHS